jgi:hypothetical protein
LKARNSPGFCNGDDYECGVPAAVAITRMSKAITEIVVVRKRNPTSDVNTSIGAMWRMKAIANPVVEDAGFRFGRGVKGSATLATSSHIRP